MLKKNVRSGRSARKPFSDVSNVPKPSDPPPLDKVPLVVGGGGDEDLDRLFEAHTELSNLVRKIDDLCGQALRLKSAHKLQSHEILSFRHVITDMHTSLEPWLWRFQQAFTKQPSVMENPSELPLASQTTSTLNGETDSVLDDSDETKMDPLISPSPLVSWRGGGCKVESGRQLFLLTPLPSSKAFSSKHQASAKTIPGKVSNLDLPPRALCLEIVEMKPTAKEISMPPIAETEVTLDGGCIKSPSKSSNCKNRDQPTYLITPCLKASSRRMIRKSTPYFFKGEPHVSDDFDSSVPASLASKYPEHFGKKADQLKGTEDCLKWFLSPPKTCVLMEPNENFVTKLPIDDLLPTEWIPRDQSARLLSARGKQLYVVERTPMWDDTGRSMFRTGKHPGETTLKKELWAKFEAVSTEGLCLDQTVFQRKGKGFLERLEEEATNVDSET
ncbi:hypothetical protein QJS10_CPB18g01007 [Acorus calamus]|uniref:Uncharacterized protein n=1 Tax=Acorus calamus TaxID=4465 RepID=A0AAV9CQC4_ACOCL|nr:hypothetical protein QJS10_CPB18g01007 [Acorus calamus]